MNTPYDLNHCFKIESKMTSKTFIDKYSHCIDKFYRYKLFAWTIGLKWISNDNYKDHVLLDSRAIF